MKHLLLAFCFFACCTLSLLAQTDTTPTPQWRPVYHFTPVKNWTNDPNGLIYRNGVYHLYNQQNPSGNGWGHMSWGHATSTDLVHWKHLPLALPETIDKDTTWRFSGCAVWDKNNTSGFCKTGGCMVIVYTADQPNRKKESQFIAYSNDNGTSFTNYAGNPVIDLNMKDFRDPSVTWNEQLKKWLMVVALPWEHKVAFYASPNLKNWELLSQFGPAGYTSAAWECPSLMQLPIDGSNGKKKWVMTVSAAGAERGVFIQYFVGEFDGKKFINDNAGDAVLAVDNGDCFYAAIPWNEVPAAKTIYIGWLMPGPQATYPWRGQMSVPRDLSLRQTAAGYRLVQRPSSIIQHKLASLSNGNIISLTNIQLDNTEKVLITFPKMNHNSYWIDAVFTVTPGSDIGFKLGQQKDGQTTIAETVVGYNAADKTIYIDKTRTGNAPLDKDHPILKTETGIDGNSIRLQILLDKSSLEVFSNDGEKVLTTYVFPGSDAYGLSFFARHGSTTIQSLKIWDLSGVDKKQE